MATTTDTRLEGFPSEVSDVIQDGLKHGVSDEQMIKGMISIGNLMGKFVQPDSPEESLIKEMWEEADESDKEVMAKLVLKIGKKRIH